MNVWAHSHLGASPGFSISLESNYSKFLCTLLPHFTIIIIIIICLNVIFSERSLSKQFSSNIFTKLLHEPLAWFYIYVCIYTHTCVYTSVLVCTQVHIMLVPTWNCILSLFICYLFVITGWNSVRIRSWSDLLLCS